MPWFAIARFAFSALHKTALTLDGDTFTEDGVIFRVTDGAAHLRAASKRCQTFLSVALECQPREKNARQTTSGAEIKPLNRHSVN